MGCFRCSGKAVKEPEDVNRSSTNDNDNKNDSSNSDNHRGPTKKAEDRAAPGTYREISRSPALFVVQVGRFRQLGP
ncbi:Protein kinase domain-containing protein [Psidium guajava]|nr:Protein kinase domain-containing protein [Psidium guajava]